MRTKVVPYAFHEGARGFGPRARGVDGGGGVGRARIRRLHAAEGARLAQASLVGRVAKRLRCDRATAERAVAAILQASGDAMRRGELVDPGAALGLQIRLRRGDPRR